jgi:hypothetical protein
MRATSHTRVIFRDFIKRRVQITMLFILQFSLVSCHNGPSRPFPGQRPTSMLKFLLD